VALRQVVNAEKLAGASRDEEVGGILEFPSAGVRDCQHERSQPALMIGGFVKAQLVAGQCTGGAYEKNGETDDDDGLAHIDQLSGRAREK
jgi:hypothetical protein